LTLTHLAGGSLEAKLGKRVDDLLVGHFPVLGDEKAKIMGVGLLRPVPEDLKRETVLLVPKTEATVGLALFFLNRFACVGTFMAFGAECLAKAMSPDSALRAPN
jgi:hypothetical protein